MGLNGGSTLKASKINPQKLMEIEGHQLGVIQIESLI